MTDKTLRKKTIEHAAQKAAQAAVNESVKGLLERIRLHEAIDNIIETTIPKKYTGLKRARIKDRIRENLSKEHIFHRKK